LYKKKKIIGKKVKTSFKYGVGSEYVPKNMKGIYLSINPKESKIDENKRSLLLGNYEVKTKNQIKYHEYISSLIGERKKTISILIDA